MSIFRSVLRAIPAVRSRLVTPAASSNIARSLHATRSRLQPSDPYPLPLSPELETQRAQPHGGVESSTSSALNTETEEEWPMPQPLDRTGEDEKTIRARLVYQTRKRGMLEGDLLLSTFARDNLGTMNMAELQQFDKLLDEPDWDIYYWSIEKRHPPERWAGTELLEKLKKHAKNEGKVVRFMPELKDEPQQ